MLSKNRHLLVINGPNLNLLGTREPRHYGQDTLEAIIARLIKQASTAGAKLVAFQSNSEADLVNRIQQAAKERVDFIIINPAGYTHTSVAMRDALSAVRIPFVEVHLSNVFARESFRRESFFSDIAVGVISGLGGKGYELALEFALDRGVPHRLSPQRPQTGLLTRKRSRRLGRT
jgi:3-dehydroquinate dehydratase II